MHVLVINSKKDPYCGCLEEEVEIDGAYCFFHLQPDGVSDVYIDMGDSGAIEYEEQGVTSKEVMYQKISDKLISLPVID